MNHPFVPDGVRVTFVRAGRSALTVWGLNAIIGKGMSIARTDIWYMAVWSEFSVRRPGPGRFVFPFLQCRDAACFLGGITDD